MNAAYLYRDAFSQLPEGESGDLLQLVGSDTPEAESLVQQGRAALDALRRAAACPDCDWGHRLTMDVPVKDFSDARRLTALALLRASRALRGGEVGAALDDLLAVMALGRHLGQGLYLCGMVGFAIEDLAATEVLGLLGGLDRDACLGLAARLDALPPFPDLIATVRAEQDYFRANYRDWFAALDEAAVEPALRAQFGLTDEQRALAGPFLPGGDPAEEMLRASGGDKARLMAMAGEALGAFDALASVAGGEPADRLAPLREAAANNPLLADVLQSFDRARPTWERFQARGHRLRARVVAGGQGTGEDRGPTFSVN
jgi:hypothetical protein